MVNNRSIFHDLTFTGIIIFVMLLIPGRFIAEIDGSAAVSAI